jgi:hypothetical protein
MTEIVTSGSMSGERKRDYGRPTAPLPNSTGQSSSIQGGNAGQLSHAYYDGTDDTAPSAFDAGCPAWGTFADQRPTKPGDWPKRALNRPD